MAFSLEPPTFSNCLHSSLPIRSGDYQQKFVGLDDVVESEDDAPPRARRGAVPKKGARTKECPGCGAKLGVSIKECSYCDYAFTSRSMLVATTTVEEESANIRSRFAFEPEREEDGSLMIEKLIGRRLRKDKARSHLKSSQFVSLSATEAKYDYEYLVKYKQMSFLHVQWLSAHEIDSMSKNSKQVLTRYLKAVDLAAPNIQEDGEVDPSYVEVEKILDVREEEVFDVQDETRPPDEAETLDTEAADGAMEVDGPAGASSSASSFASYSSALEPAPSGKSLGTYSTTGEPIVLSSTTVFNPNERCRRVLNRICDDPFASSFLEPVDTELYDDYEDTVEQPMCLNDVRESLEKGMYRKHQGYTRFAQDMRLIWANCKVRTSFYTPPCPCLLFILTPPTPPSSLPSLPPLSLLSLSPLRAVVQPVQVPDLALGARHVPALRAHLPGLGGELLRRLASHGHPPGLPVGLHLPRLRHQRGRGAHDFVRPLRRVLPPRLPAASPGRGARGVVVLQPLRALVCQPPAGQAALRQRRGRGEGQHDDGAGPRGGQDAQEEVPGQVARPEPPGVHLGGGQGHQR